MVKTINNLWSFFLLTVTCFIVGCSDNDSFTTNPTTTLAFSTDSVKMDTVFSTIPSRTYDLWVYNRSRDGVRLTSVRLRQGNQTGFRVNVDGSYLDNTLGSVVHDLEVRKGDSIRVFVELTAPENGQPEAKLIEDDLVFTLESGVEQRVCLRGYAWDALLLHDVVVGSDSLIESTKPIVVYGGLCVDSAATLTIRNTTLYFHDQAGIDVYGTIKAENTLFRGDRLDHMFDYLPYDRVSGQWRGIHIHPSSFWNEFIDSEIRSAEQGIVCDSAAFSPDVQRLYMERSVIHNCKGPGLLAFNSYIGLLRCQLTNTLGDCLAVYGGATVVEHCTLAQFYPFSADRGAALRFANYYGESTYPLHAMQMRGSIVTGYEEDVVMGQAHENDTTTMFIYSFENSLLRTEVATMRDAVTGAQVPDTIRFVGVLWETPKDSVQGKQHFLLIDEQNLQYDFHLDSISPAQGLGCY